MEFSFPCTMGSGGSSHHCEDAEQPETNQHSDVASEGN